MTAITIADLSNAKLDVDHIAALATSQSATATDRLGNTKQTLTGFNAAINLSASGILAGSAANAEAAAATKTAIDYKYRGALAADPATRTDGTANQTGDEVFNTSAGLLKRWNGAIWQASDISTANLAAPGGADLVGSLRPVAGAVMSTLGKRANAGVLNFVGDFDGLGDGAYSAGGVVSGTDNLAKMNLALAACTVLGKSLYIPGALYYFSAGFTIPTGVRVYGDGQCWAVKVQSGLPVNGTGLLINGQAGGDCITFQENGGHTSLKELSVYNTNTNALRAGVSNIGQLYPNVENVEIAGLKVCGGYGLLLAPSANGAKYETLWGDYKSVNIMGGVHTGLFIYSNGPNKTCNTNTFYGGDIQGRVLALSTNADVGGGSWGCSFHGTRFEARYDATNLQFVNGGARIYGHINASVYVCPVVSLASVTDFSFFGCYFEGAGYPSSYNDGTNGSLPVLPVLKIHASASRVAIKTSAISSYVFDLSSDSSIDPWVPQGFKVNNSKALASGRRIGGVQTFPNGSADKAAFSVSTQTAFEWLNWDDANARFVIRQDGTYQVNAQFALKDIPASGYAQIFLSINGVRVINGSFVSFIVSSYIPSTSVLHSLVGLSVGDIVSIHVDNQAGVSITNHADSKDSFFQIAKIVG